MVCICIHFTRHPLPAAAAAGRCVAHITCAVAIGITLKRIAEVRAIINYIRNAVIICISIMLTGGLTAATAARRCIAHIACTVAIGIKLKRIIRIRTVIRGIRNAIMICVRQH